MHFYFFFIGEAKFKERPLRCQPKVTREKKKDFTTSLLSPAMFVYAHLLGRFQVGRATGTAS